MSRVFGQIAQIGYVVRDIRASMDQWVQHGVGPWFYVDRVQTDYCRHRGVDSYPDLSTLPAELHDAVIRHGSLNVYRMIAHSAGLAPGFLTMADAVLQANSLPAPWRELAILRVGHVYGASYDVHHHENIARWVGLSDAAISAAATGSVDSLPDEEAAILVWTGRLLVNHTLSDDERAAALHLLTVNQLADLVITIGFYQLVCNFLNTFTVTTDGEGVVVL